VRSRESLLSSSEARSSIAKPTLRLLNTAYACVGAIHNPKSPRVAPWEGCWDGTTTHGFARAPLRDGRRHEVRYEVPSETALPHRQHGDDITDAIGETDDDLIVWSQKRVVAADSDDYACGVPRTHPYPSSERLGVGHWMNPPEYLGRYGPAASLQCTPSGTRPLKQRQSSHRNDDAKLIEPEPE